MGATIGGIIIVVIFFLIYWNIDLILACLKKKEVSEETDHIPLKKEPTAIIEIVNDETRMMEEFRKLEQEALENNAFSTNIAQENTQHNRYRDMGKISIRLTFIVKNHFQFHLTTT